MKRNFSNFLETNVGKVTTRLGAVGTGVVLTVGKCFAAGEDAGVASAMGTAATSVKGDILGSVAVVAPIALGIGGVFLAWKKGWGFFKSVAK